MAHAHKTNYSLRERLGIWLLRRVPWEDYLALMTCGKQDHIWRSMTGYNAADCPMCKMEKHLKRTELLLRREQLSHGPKLGDDVLAEISSINRQLGVPG
jgi:hypothetical protein